MAVPDIQWLRVSMYEPEDFIRDVETLRTQARENLDRGAVTAAYGADLERVVQMLQTAQQTSRAIVLVTDGEENVAAVGTPGEVGPLQAAQAALRHGVRVHALVVGGPAKGATGDLDTSQVEQLAQRTGGAFFRVGDARALAEVYAQIDALERSPVEESIATLEERFAPFVAAALLLWIAAATLRRVGLEVVP